MLGTQRIPTLYDPATVTSIRPDVEVPAEAVGLAPDASRRIWRCVERLYTTRMNPAINVCIRVDGQVLLDRALGHARGNHPLDGPGAVPVRSTPDTPFCLFSASKAVTAMVIHLLDDRGVLHVGDRVCDYIPEFAKHGKDWVTIRHVLTHRAGIPAVAGANQLDLLHDPDELIARMCEAKPVFKPGRRLAYHAITGGFVLGEIVRRATGRDIRTWLGDEILAPLGFTGMNYGVPEDQVHTVAENAFTGVPARGPIAYLARRALGANLDEAPVLANGVPWLTAQVPSGNIVSSANEACRFFELLKNFGELDGVRIFEPRTIRRAITETAYLEMDLTLMLPVRYGVGLMLGSPYFGLFGPRTAHAFGHLGFTNMYCWADPSRRMSAAILTSGKPLFSRHVVPLAHLLTTISRVIPERGP